MNWWILAIIFALPSIILWIQIVTGMSKIKEFIDAFSEAQGKWRKEDIEFRNEIIQYIKEKRD